MFSRQFLWWLVQGRREKVYERSRSVCHHTLGIAFISLLTVYFLSCLSVQIFTTSVDLHEDVKYAESNEVLLKQNLPYKYNLFVTLKAERLGSAPRKILLIYLYNPNNYYTKKVTSIDQTDIKTNGDRNMNL